MGALIAIVLSPNFKLWAQNEEIILHEFDGGNDASRPTSGLAEDAAGNLYGTSLMGGEANSGVVYELSPAAGGWQERVIHSFSGRADGSEPSNGLVIDANGNLYGTASTGGAYGWGTAFRLSPSGNGQWSFILLHTFSDKEDGSGPGALILDSEGNLYGTASGGGPSHRKVCFYGCGVVYELSPTASGPWTETVLYSFFGGKDGRYPGGVIFDKAGNLYGTASQGGNFQSCGSPLGCGVVFELSPTESGSWNENVLYAFSGRDGLSPSGQLVFDYAGNLYGATFAGGDINSCPDGCGVIFELTPTATGFWQETLLHTFRGPVDGQGPLNPLTPDGNGNFYGVTEVGGPYSGGLVFELSPSGDGNWTIKALNEFVLGGFKGSGPNAGLLLDSRNNLYGTTGSGGPAGTDGGLAFEIDASP